ncbi:hypothetical protein [Streptomyces sp. NPDC093094]|uniref:hypothetical protein n=1 Tax=Streptomyces sp. NPDC093094 TaxID=3366026 RepID=UPI00380A7CEE
MTRSGGEGPGEPDFGEVRWNGNGEVEFYDGTAWRAYADDAVDDDWEEPALYRLTPETRGTAPQDPSSGEDDPDGPDPA